MGVKLTDKNKDKTAPAVTKATTPAPSPAPAPVPAGTPAPKTVMVDGKKIIPTSGVFMISSPNGVFKYIGTSTRIEVCIRDYFKWLADNKHGSVEMQKAYKENGDKLNWSILKTCDKAEFAVEKAKACKEHNIDIKIPFSKDVIKAADINPEKIDEQMKAGK